MIDVTAQLANVEMLEVEVSGPDGANRLYICSGQYPTAWYGNNSSEVFTAHIGPTLGRREFVGASGSVALTGIYVASPLPVGASIRGFDSDWDDDEGRVRLTVQVVAQGPAGITGFSYTVSILAQVNTQ